MFTIKSLRLCRTYFQFLNSIGFPTFYSLRVVDIIPRYFAISYTIKFCSVRCIKVVNYIAKKYQQEKDMKPAWDSLLTYLLCKKLYKGLSSFCYVSIYEKNRTSIWILYHICWKIHCQCIFQFISHVCSQLYCL